MIHKHLSEKDLCHQDCVHGFVHAVSGRARIGRMHDNAAKIVTAQQHQANQSPQREYRLPRVSMGTSTVSTPATFLKSAQREPGNGASEAALHSHIAPFSSWR